MSPIIFPGNFKKPEICHNDPVQNRFMNLESKRRKLDEFKYDCTSLLTPTSSPSKQDLSQTSQQSSLQNSQKIDGGYIHIQTFVKHNAIPRRLYSNDVIDIPSKYSSFFGWMYILQMIKEDVINIVYSENGIEENIIGNHSKMKASFVSIYRSLLYVASLKKNYIISSIKLITDDLKTYNCLSSIDETVPNHLKGFSSNLRQIIRSMKVQISYSNTMILVKPVILNESQIEFDDKENSPNLKLVIEEIEHHINIKQCNPPNTYIKDSVDKGNDNLDNKCNIISLKEVKKDVLCEIKKDESSLKPNIKSVLDHKLKQDPIKLPFLKPDASFNEKDLLSLDVLKIDKNERIQHTLPFFIQVVTDSKQKFYQFCQVWRSVKQFSWSLYARSRLTYQDYQKFKIISPDDHYLFFNDHQIRSLSICFEKHRVFVIELHSENVNKKDEIAERWQIVKSIMESESNEKILHGMKTQLKLFLSHDIDVRHNLLDPKIGMWMINPDLYKETTIDELSQMYMKNIIYPKNIDQFLHSVKLAHQSFIIMPYVEDNLKANFQFDLFKSVEMKLLPIIAKIEFYGMGFEESSFNDIKSRIANRIEYIQNHAHELAGRNFELSSPMEVSNVLFEELKLPYPENKLFGRKPKVIKKSTKASVLKAMCQMDNPHPLPKLILDYRKLRHILSVYIEQLPKYCFFYKRLGMNRILPIYNQTVVPTGRIACEHPNLQSIMRSVTLNLDEIDATPNDQPQLLEVNIRDAFIASEGMIFLSVDYCQLEFRLMTHFSQDPVALSNINDKSIDIFKHLASHWLNKPYDSINDRDRSNVKSICYGLLYGMGEASFSESIGVTVEEGRKLMKSFKETFKGFNTFSNEVYEFCKTYGYIHTIDGRRRYIEGINSSVNSEVAQAKRLAINSVCQGSAADIVKRAMIRIEEFFYSIKTTSRLVLNLHDELLYEVNESELNYIGSEIKRIMESCIEISVPLNVRLSIGKKWGSLKPWVVE